MSGLTRRIRQKVRDLLLTWSQVNGAATAGHHGSQETGWASMAGGGHQRTRGLMDHGLGLGNERLCLPLPSLEGGWARLSWAGSRELLNEPLEKRSQPWRAAVEAHSLHGAHTCLPGKFPFN